MVVLRDFQKDALDRLDSGKILYGGVGSGKSLVALAYWQKEFKDKNLYVITTAKKRNSLEWEGNLIKMGLSTGGVVVDSWNNIKKYEDVTDGFFIFDEQRIIGWGAWTKSFLRINKHNPWVLLSATPGDTWMDYIPVFVANGFYKNKTEFTQSHVIYSRFTKYPKVDRFISEKKLEYLRRKILVPMRYTRETRRHVEKVVVDCDLVLEKELIKTRWNREEGRPYLNASELMYALRKVSNGDRSRYEKTLEIARMVDRVIVFYNFNYELEMLRGLKDDLEGFEVAEWNGHVHEPLPGGDRWVYLVQYMAGAEGWECISTNRVLFYSLTYSYRQFEQSMGRIDRMNTLYEDLYYYVLMSRSRVDMAISKALNARKTFNERAFIGSW